MKPNHILRSPEPGEGGGGAPAPAPAAPAPSPAAPAPSAPAPAPAAPAPALGAPAPAPSSSAPAPAPAEPAAIWPENWRQTVSKEDAKRLAQLERYASPEAAIQALFAAQDRIRSGELKPVLGKNATAEDLKEWRTAHGVPETHDKYDLGKDVKIEDADKPMFDVMFKAMHGENATPGHVSAMVKTFYSLKQQAVEHQATKDAETQKTSEDALRAEWGGEYRRNINLISGLLDGAGTQGLKDKILGGRLSDGTPIGSSPDVLKLLVGLSLIQNPTGVVVPGGDAAREAGIESEIESIEKLMKTNRKEYDKDEKKQERLRQLYSAREALKPKK